mmetsp:Transcript_23633/g.65068  ORF Transcript_23633/g.65068 Transcript_23633/m.65068 type:complete len:224 (+) Transcript_23633:1502-2173(+)
MPPGPKHAVRPQHVIPAWRALSASLHSHSLQHWLHLCPMSGQLALQCSRSSVQRCALQFRHFRRGPTKRRVGLFGQHVNPGSQCRVSPSCAFHRQMANHNVPLVHSAAVDQVAKPPTHLRVCQDILCCEAAAERESGHCSEWRRRPKGPPPPPPCTAHTVRIFGHKQAVSRLLSHRAGLDLHIVQTATPALQPLLQSQLRAHLLSAWMLTQCLGQPIALGLVL